MNKECLYELAIFAIYEQLLECINRNSFRIDDMSRHSGMLEVIDRDTIQSLIEKLFDPILYLKGVNTNE